MPQFIELSRVNLNVNTIKTIASIQSKQGGCIVYFIDGREPHVFFGSDADKLLELVSQNRLAPQTELAHQK